MMQNHYEISWKTLFWNQKHSKFHQKSWFGHVRTWKVVIWSCPDLKSRDLDMSGPEKSWFGHVRTCPGGQVLTSKQRNFFFWDFTPFHFLWQVLTANQRKYFYFFRFYTFPFFISKFSIFYKIMCFYAQIYHFL